MLTNRGPATSSSHRARLRSSAAFERLTSIRSGRATRSLVCRAQSGGDNGAPWNPEDENFVEATNLNFFRSGLETQWQEKAEANITGKIDHAIERAKDVCRKDPTFKSWNDCAIAWEEVDELSIAKERKLSNKQTKMGFEKEDTPKPSMSADDFERQQRLWAKGTKFVPKDSVARQLMDAEIPCSLNGVDCDPPSGGLNRAGKLESAFGGSTKEHFEKLLKDHKLYQDGKPPKHPWLDSKSNKSEQGEHPDDTNRSSSS